MDFSPEEKAEVRQWALGRAKGSYRRTCPACSQTRRNSKAQCLSVTIQADHVLMNCHHCERHGATYLHERPSAFTPPPVEKPRHRALKRLDKGLNEDGIAFLKSRGVSLKTAQVFGIVSARAYFPDLSREDEAVAFPFYVGTKVSGHKVRSLTEKAHICDAPLSSLFGIQNVDLSESEDVIFTEGEIDAMSFYEAAILNAVSVPNGSSSFNNSNDDGSLKAQLGFLWDAKDKLDAAKRILIATDMDEPGEKIAEELARRVGRHRCWRVSFPEGCKDANETLLKGGPAALQECLSTATPWPVDGLYEADKYFDEYDALYDHGFGDRIKTGIEAVDEYFSVAPGMLTIVSGNPNSGKSTFIDQIVLNLARDRGYITAMCSFENTPQVHLGKMAAMLIQKHFFDTEDPGEKMSREEMQSVKPFLLRHIKFLSQEDGNKSTIDNILERIKAAVYRWGVRVVVVDPANYIQRPSSSDSETAFWDDVLTRLRLTAALYGIHIFLIAHPRKMEMLADGTYQVPKGYSIAGSAAFFSKPDHGLTVHRLPDTNEVEIHVWKTRYDWLGKNGKCSIYYDAMRHVYVSGGFDEFIPYSG